MCVAAAVTTALWLGVIASALAAESPPSIDQQRLVFQQAEYAIHKGQRQIAKRLTERLKAYALYPYLIYQTRRRYLYAAQWHHIQKFRYEYADTPLANRLHKAWLRQLAEQQQWSAYLNAYHPYDDVALACYYLYAQVQLKTKNNAELVAAVEPLWLVPKSQPKACDPLFAWWRQVGNLSVERVWKRIQLAAQARNRHLMKYLRRYLPKQEQSMVDLWLVADQKPRMVIQSQHFPSHHPMTTSIVTHAFTRLIHKDELQAEKLWPHFKTLYALSRQQEGELSRKLALMLAIRGHKQATTWLAHIPNDAVDDTIHEWRVRHALALLNWRASNDWIRRMPPQLQHSRKWRYWLARSLDQLGQRKQAQIVYRKLAEKPDYYGFLASEQAGMPYPIHHQPTPAMEYTLDRVQRQPGIQRAYELRILHKIGEARREWEWALQHLSKIERQAAAQLASRWNWYDRAIYTARGSDLDSDLALHYPLAHEAIVRQAAELRNIDPAWAFAISRQESMFTHDAKSPMGALGVMQLLPSTAHRLAKEHCIDYQGKRQLLDVDTNIHLGTAYLRKMFDRYQKNALLATAAYNAGPNRVAQWLPTESSVPADVWIDTLPFFETRHYLKNVLTNTVIYEFNMGRQPQLNRHMQAILSSSPS